MENVTVQKTSRVSRLKVGIAAVAIGALLVVPSASADTEVVDFNIAGGVLSMELREAGLGDIEDYGLDMFTTGSVDVEVSDLRGTDGNWSVSLEADDFERTGGDGSISAGDFSVSDADTIDESNGIDGGTVESHDPQDLSSASLLGTGSGAHGVYTWSPALHLDVADGTPAGEYTSTLTITETAAP
ncbi:MAG: hypothetical protein EA415_14690 [Sphaerobacteraceae bacterium]|nr:MAG: hypothetical protein EA415_14690 [Sphaerobacteraceae bacterium]